MITNELLEEKWRVQEKIAQKAGYDVKEYARSVHRIVEEASS